MSPQAKDGSMVMLLRLAVCFSDVARFGLLLSLATLVSCVSSMDTQSLEEVEAVAAMPVATSSSGRLDHTFTELGLYKVSGGGVSAPWTGTVGMTGLTEQPLSSAEFVAGLGERVELSSSSGEAVELQRIVGRALEVVSTESPTLELDQVAGRWRAKVMRGARVQVRESVSLLERRPTAYRLGNQTVTADQHDNLQVQWWIFFAPVEIGRLVSRALGSRLEEPQYGPAVVVGTDTGKEVTEEPLPWRQPVKGRKCRWALFGASEKLTFRGEVVTLEDGMAFIPIEEQAERIEADIDLGRVARLEIVDVESGAKVEASVDLLDIIAKRRSP